MHFSHLNQDVGSVYHMHLLYKSLKSYSLNDKLTEKILTDNTSVCGSTEVQYLALSPHKKKVDLCVLVSINP